VITHLGDVVPSPILDDRHIRGAKEATMKRLCVAAVALAATVPFGSIARAQGTTDLGVISDAAIIIDTAHGTWTDTEREVLSGTLDGQQIVGVYTCTGGGLTGGDPISGWITGSVSCTLMTAAAGAPPAAFSYPAIQATYFGVTDQGYSPFQPGDHTAVCHGYFAPTDASGDTVEDEDVCRII